MGERSKKEVVIILLSCLFILLSGSLFLSSFIISDSYEKNNNFSSYSSSLTGKLSSSGLVGLIVLGTVSSGWTNISSPEGIFEPASSLSGTHKSLFSIRFTDLSINANEELRCEIKSSNGSLIIVNTTGLALQQQNYSLNYTIQSSDSIINDSSAGYLPWILKNCSIINSSGLAFDESKSSRIYTHSPVYWADSEVTRAVACQGTPGVYFNNTGKCEFMEDTAFALQMRNGNNVVADCFNNPGVSCSENYCRGIYFPTCDPIDYFGGYSANTDDPNGYTTFTVSFAGYNTPIAYSMYTNSSGNLKLRINQSLTSKEFSFTIYNLTSVSSANVYGVNAGGGTTSVSDNGDGTYNVAHNRLSSGFTGTLDFVLNISFSNPSLNENRTLKFVIAYGVDTNQGTPSYFDEVFSVNFGLQNIKENKNSSVTSDLNGVCGDGVNNDFDFLGLGGIWANSYDCFDADCNNSLGATQTNEFGSGKTGICNYAKETNCSDSFDNDYDYIAGTGYTDCHDSDCFQNGDGLNTCHVSELVCNDSLNDDWDYTLSESEVASGQKISNNGTKYDSTHQANLMDCEDIDCNGSVGGSSSSQICNWGYEKNCSDGFNNDALQLKDCELSSLGSSTAMPTPAYGEYDCSSYCRATNVSNESGAQCNDNIDNDWDAIVTSGYYSDQYTSNTTYGSGIDCRWGGYFGYGSNYNPDENCDNETLSNGYQCQLQRERNCTDQFDNDYDSYAGVTMPNSGWSINSAGYLSFFNLSFVSDADYDDYDCQVDSGKPVVEDLASAWCFDGIDNNLDAYYWNGALWASNISSGSDCYDPSCTGVTNPNNSIQTCLLHEYNVSDSFFGTLPYPGFYCNNSFDDDSDGNADCADSDCFKQFNLCSKYGPCYDFENVSWSSCSDGVNNDYSNGIDCADSNCVGMFGSLNGAICTSVENICYDSFDNNANGNVDCADHASCDESIGGKVNNVSVYCRASESTLSDCFDGFDNDADGSMDCYDVGCNAVCNLSTISGTTPISLPSINGPIAINSVTNAYVETETVKVRKTQWYNITFKMTESSTDAQWSLGTATGGKFNNTAFNFSSVYISGPNAGSFILTESPNGFILDSNGASLPSGYSVSFSIQSLEVMAASTYELTYLEETGSKTSLNNLISYEVDENTAPQAQSLEVIPNSGMNYAGTVYLRANISDNNQLGACMWSVYGAASFSPATSTNCRASFIPTVEGIYYVNVTPKDYYSNLGSTLSDNFTLNIIPSGKSIVTSSRFYNQSNSMVVNATFNIVSSDNLGNCQVLIRNASGSETNLGSFSASANSCYSNSVSLTGIADGEYSVFVRVEETTDGNIIEGNSTGVFICSQSSSGVCKFTDFNSDGRADVCVDSVLPNVSLISPVDNITTESTSLSFSCNASDDYELKNISLFTNISGVFSILNSSNVSGRFNESIFNMNNLPTGFYSWSCQACDSYGNCKFAEENRTFTIGSVVVPTPTPGTGGTSGGGAKVKETAGLKGVEDNWIILTPPSLEVVVNRGDKTTREVTIENTLNHSIEIKISVGKTISGFVNSSLGKITLNAGEKKNLILNIQAVSFGNYIGTVNFEADGLKKELLVMLNVKDVSSLFDVYFNIPSWYQKIYSGENLNAQVSLFRIKGDFKEKIYARYFIKDLQGNVLYEKKESFYMEKSKVEFSREFATSEFSSGKYIAGVEIKYHNGFASASAQFEFFKGLNIKLIIMIIVALLFLLFLIYLVIKYKSYLQSLFSRETPNKKIVGEIR